MFYEDVGLFRQDLPGDRKQIRALAGAKNLDDFVKVAGALSPEDGRELARALAAQVSPLAVLVLERLGVDTSVPVTDLYGRVLELTPDQQEIVDLDLTNKTLIVRGVAGSGKTSIAVNRITRAALNDRSLEGRYTLITFGSVLRDACEEHIQTLCGGSMPSNIEVLTFHKWALPLIQQAHPNIGGWRKIEEMDLTACYPDIQQRIAGSASEDHREWFESKLILLGPFGSPAWNRILKGPDHEEVPTHERNHRFWLHLLVVRVGLLRLRSLPFSWAGVAAWLTSTVASATLPQYREIVVDEVQDLDPFAFLAAAQSAAARGASLLFLGDDAQAVHRADFSWENVGQLARIQRVTEERELSTNFRSPPGLQYQAERLKSSQRPGNETGVVPPRRACEQLQLNICHCRMTSPEEMAAEYVDLLFDSIESGETICVLTHYKSPDGWKRSAAHWHQANIVAALRSHYVPVEVAREYGSGGVSLKTDAVKVMTVRDAKGLEFDHVIAFRFERGDFPGRNKTLQSKQIFRRMLHTLVTRARKSVTFFGNADHTGNYLTYLLTEELDFAHVNESTDVMPPLVLG